MAGPLDETGRCNRGFRFSLPCSALALGNALPFAWAEGDPFLARSLEEADPLLNNDYLSSIAWNADASAVAVGSWNGHVLVYAVGRDQING